MDNKLLSEITDGLMASYADAAAVSYHDDRDLPQSSQVIDILQQLLELLFPGYSGKCQFYRNSAAFATGERLNAVWHDLKKQIARSLCCNCRIATGAGHCNTDECQDKAGDLSAQLLKKLPEIRELLKLDGQAALDGDPATRSMDEIILAYPGYHAIAIHRIAHELYAAKIPIIPRIMSEYAHTVTGIDIHPGAAIGKSFFIDHGTGVVIGETAVLGDNVKLYQGVTLGALSFPKDGCGHLIKGMKRHPNLEDNVTVYAGATILGDVTIAHHSVIGGNVWLTDSVPEPYSRVIFSPSDISVNVRK